MSGLQEIIDLFSSLALQIHTPNSTSAADERAIDLSISDLNRSLNPPGEDSPSSSRVRVLDTVLSLMCFKAPQVFDLRAEYLVRTIVSLLSSSVGCKAYRVQNRQILHIGSSISRVDCLKLLETLDHLIQRLEDRDIIYFNLLYAVIRAVALAGCFQYTCTHIPTVDPKALTDIRPILSRLIHYIPDVVLHEDQGRELRLIIWYLDPFMLKRDVLKVLQCVEERSFLCLSNELRQRSDWHSLIKCLALCPAMFIETRTLLHSWFLVTGLSFVLKLQTHLLATLLDVITQPTWWGMSMDVGSKLPFLHAYFPCNIYLLRLLAGPLSLESFTSLVQIIEKAPPHNKRNVEEGLKQAPTIANIRHHSKWGIAINFPNWFLFASSLLFCDRTSGQSYQPKDILQKALSKQLLLVESSSSAAASYIAWILCPVNNYVKNNLKDCLIRLSGSLTKQLLAETLDKEREGHKKKFKRLKGQAKGSSPRLNIGQWLEEFCDSFSNSSSFCLQESFLLRRIPLGALLAFSNHINEYECELLLHYGATGRIISSMDSTYAGHQLMNSEESNTKEAIAGACFIFELTDACENMSASLFENEEEAQAFIHLVKKRAEKYLLRCIRTLLEAELNGDRMLQMLMDLHGRILKWRDQGEDSPLESQGLDEAVTALKEKVPCI